MKLKLKPPLSYEVAKMLKDAGYNESRNLHCGGEGYPCRDRLFCPRCCAAQYSTPLSNEFVRPVGENEQRWILTVSQQYDALGVRFYFPGVPLMDDLGRKPSQEVFPPEKFGLEFTTQKDLERFSLVWKIAMDSLGCAVRRGKGKHISGLLMFPRLSVQFRPLRVLPFVNALAVSSGPFDEKAARDIRRTQCNKLRNTRRLARPLHAWFHGRLLVSEQEQSNVLVHNSKPIPIEEALAVAEGRPVSDKPELEIFLANVVKVYRDVPRVHRLGVFHPHHHAYIGMNQNETATTA